MKFGQYDSREYKIRMIADHYNYEQQSHITIEECSEIIKAISKLERKKASPEESSTFFYVSSEEYRALIEEMADVQIMIWQLEYLLGAEEAADDIIDQKLDRQIERIAAEKEAKL